MELKILNSDYRLKQMRCIKYEIPSVFFDPICQQLFISFTNSKKRFISLKLSVMWKSDLTDKMKRSFFQSAVVLILLYGCTTWTLTKRLGKKLDGNNTRMLRAILNKSWRQHPTRHQLYGHLPPMTKTIQVRHAAQTCS